MYIRVIKHALCNSKNICDRGYVNDQTPVIIPVFDEVFDDSHIYRWTSFWIPTYYNGKKYYINTCIESLERARQLFYKGDKIKIKGCGDTVFTVAGGGRIMYRAKSPNGKEVRRNYINKKGEPTFELLPIVREEITIEKSDGFNVFMSAVKTNASYQNDKYDKNIFKNYKAAVKAKTELREILSKHPNWNETQQCVELSVSIKNKPEVNTISATAAELKNIIGKQKIFSLDSIDFFYNFFTAISRPHYFDNVDDVIKLNRRGVTYCGTFPFGCELNYNAKISKVVSSVMNYYNVERNHEVERAFAKYSDSVSTKEIEYKLVLSINPADFVTMSHGNSWRSCHSFQHSGGWHSGCLSYALDNSTMIAYVIPKNTDGVYALQPKIKRLLFMLSEDRKTLMSTKMYPDNTDMSARVVFDDTVLGIINEAGIKIDNCVVSHAPRFNTTGSHYPDYQYSGQHKIYGSDGTFVFNVGSKYYDFATGLESESTGMCNCGIYSQQIESITLMTDEIMDIMESAARVAV